MEQAVRAAMPRSYDTGMTERQSGRGLSPMPRIGGGASSGPAAPTGTSVRRRSARRRSARTAWFRPRGPHRSMPSRVRWRCHWPSPSPMRSRSPARRSHHCTRSGRQDTVAGGPCRRANASAVRTRRHRLTAGRHATVRTRTSGAPSRSSSARRSQARTKASWTTPAPRRGRPSWRTAGRWDARRSRRGSCRTRAPTRPVRRTVHPVVACSLSRRREPFGSLDAQEIGDGARSGLSPPPPGFPPSPGTPGAGRRARPDRAWPTCRGTRPPGGVRRCRGGPRGWPAGETPG